MRHFSMSDFKPAAGRDDSASRSSASTQEAAPRAGRSRMVASLVLGGLVLIIAIATATVMLIANARDRAIADTNRELKNTAFILAEQIDRAFQALELVQRSTIERMESLGIKSQEDLRKGMSTRDMFLMLQDKISGLPQVESVALFDAAGDLVNWSRPLPVRPMSVAERDYYKAMVADKRLTSFLGAPVLNRSTGTWSVYLARKFAGADGELLGFVLAGMRLEHFEDFFASIVLGDGAAISMFRDDGTLLARFPRVDGAIGQSKMAYPMSPANRSEMRRLTSRIDGQERLISSHRLGGYPVLVSVSKTLPAALAQAQQEERLFAAGGVLSCLVVVGILVLLVRQLLRGQRQTQQIFDAQSLKLNTALDNMSHGLCMFDAAGRLVLCNRRYLQMYGLSPKIVRPGILLRDMVRHREETGSFRGNVEQFCSEILAAIAGGTTTTLAFETASGRTIRLVSQPIENGWWISTHEDITEQRRAEAELERTKTFLDTVIDNVPAGIVVKTAGEGRFVLVNRAAEKLWDFPRDTALGKTAHDVFPKDRADLIAKHDAAALQSDEPVFLDAHMNLARADDARHMTSKRLAIRDRDGKPQYVISVVEDVTERKRAEDERDRNRKFLDRIIENVPATIFVKNREGRYVLINRAAEQLWGIKRDRVIGKTSAEVFPDAEAELILRRDEQLTGPGQQVFFDEHPVRTPGNGTRIVTSTRLTIPGADGSEQYLLGVVEDVTERKSIERQLQQSQRIEAIGSLTGGLAHDFNNLLLIMIANLDLLKEDVAGNEGAEEKVETILEAGLRGAQLTKQMLAFSRRQPLQPKRVDVNTLVDNTMQMLRRTLGETITYDLQLAADLWQVFADETQLESALVNIAINARDAMPKGGNLTIATGNLHADDGFAAHHAEFAPGDYVTISITDTGCGMPPEVVARIFEPFFTTKAPGKGTGLGLAMVYGFIKQSKGHISAYSEVDHGTTFRIYLPRDTKGDGQAKSSASAQAPLPRAKAGEVILAVDDNRGVRAAVVTQLRELGYEVIEADDAKSALMRLESQKVDLLFSDVVMPGGMGGKELAQKAQAFCPALKVLLTSGFPSTSTGSETDLEIEHRLLSKPYRKYELAATLREVLDGPAAS
jgi:PAS domain S-box-containing protein